MNILVINTGSSSLKYRLLDMETQRPLVQGLVERIGSPGAGIIHRVFSPVRETRTKDLSPTLTHEAAMQQMAGMIIQPVDAIGHRVVMGGEAFNQAVQINGVVKKAIQDHIPLAPLHNPANLAGIEAAEKFFPGKAQVAVFDTNFHQTLPEKAFLYALPYHFYSENRVRRYGFHGTSHQYLVQKTASLMEKPVDKINLITLHLGNGCSVSAVKGGQCQDTSMGMTPLAGLMMGTRAGDLDPAIPEYLMKVRGMTATQIQTVLNRESGFKGICGFSDLRDIHDRADRGDQQSRLAIEMFVHRIRKYIGAYAVVLGRVDGVVFTGGIGENDPVIRARILSDMEILGLRVDPDKNREKMSGPFHVHHWKSPVQIWVVPANEELQIAIETLQVLETPVHRAHPPVPGWRRSP